MAATPGTSAPTPPVIQDAIALARTAPLTRGGVAELAKKLAPGVARAAAVAALDAAGVNAAMVLAFAAASRGEALPADLTRALVPEVAALDHTGPLASATEGGALDVLVAVLEDELADLELSCLAMLLAADALGERPAPAALLTRGRWLSRHGLTGDASIHLGAAAIRLKDADLSALASPHVNRARRAKKTIDATLERARRSPLDALDDAEGARVSTGFTVRHEAPPVGRNDPCPCGSGKKYKKCHALTEGAPVVAAPKIDAASVGPDQAALLRPSEIAALETARLSPKAFVSALRRVVDFRQWSLALRMLGEAKGRKDLAEQVDGLALDALHGAYGAGARDAAEQLHALLPPELAEREAFALDCLRAPPDLLARIEREAERAIASDADGARGVLLASALLRWLPALGIYVARGALHETRTRDSQGLLERIEDARDRLLVSPFEAWWDVYDAFFEAVEDRREQKKDDARRAKMKDDLRRARAASRKTAAELEKLQLRVAELDAIAPPPRPEAKRAPGHEPLPSPELTEERRRLKTKIEELQRIIGEGQDERRELRRQLADRDERDEDEAPSTARGAKTPPPDDDGPEDADGDGVEAPRSILVPRYSERASKAVTELAADAAEVVLGVVAGLAAGKPNAWGGVKQLAKVRGVLSARAGIHHRVLFSIQDRALEVLEVLHRRELEQVVARLARAV